MRNILLLLTLFVCVNLQAQLSEGGKPYSYNLRYLKSYSVIPVYSLKTIDAATLEAEDKENPTPVRYAEVENAEIDIKNGVSQNISGGTIWQYTISSAQAKSLQLSFKKFVIPQGASLFVYNNSYSQIAGAFTVNNVQADSTLILADFPGNELTIEYFEPTNKSFEGKVIIGSIGKAYKDLYSIKSNLIDGYLNVNCPEGRDWQETKHAVCKISFQSGRYSYLCSGSLINNTNQDGTPYFLTANHCFSDSTSAKTVVAYFNYEVNGCNGDTLKSQTLSGATLQTTGSKSDYTLIKLNSAPPARYKPVYAGWNITGTVGMKQVGIHHPEGFPQKISFENDSAISYNGTITWDNNSTPANTHWQVEYDLGKTGEGSSGSPLFDAQHRILGQLHGGDTIYDYYGRLDYSWTVSTTGYKTMKSFLDANNTGSKTLNSYIPATNYPSAFFTVPFSTVCIASPIMLKDYSTFTPTSWKWTFSPSTVSFVNGTNSNSQNPTVQFDAAGSYTIKLVVGNSAGSDSLTMKDIITAGNSINVGVTSIPASEICYCKFDSVAFSASGADSYNWNLINNSNTMVSMKNTQATDTAYLKPLTSYVPDTSYTIQFKVIGTQGTCSDTATVSYKIIKQKNDDIANATLITVGSNGPYSNQCATVQTNEPVPPYSSCTSQLSWCDEFGTGSNILGNSVWFKFVGPSTGIASIGSNGMDNEIAVYRANSASDILNGSYTLLGANDDQNSTNSNPLIKSISVTSGKTYWVQVDGSGGNSEGSFTLTLSSQVSTALSTTETSDQLIAYPIPVNDVLNIQSDLLLNESFTASVFSVTGSCLYNQEVKNNASSLYQINTSEWKPGVYLLKIQLSDTVKTIRFVKS
jgi:PKD repeat protein